ncbi:MAG: HEAT repeat domain-containing protein [candidate division WOR-3 bacterium]
MFFRSLKKFLFLLFCFSTIFAKVPEEDYKIIIEKSRNFGIEEKDFNFKKDFSVNDSFKLPIADTLLNNPLLLVKKREFYIDSIVNLQNYGYFKNEYEKFSNHFELIEKYTNDVNSILRERIKINVEKSKEILQLIPLLFFEESLSYIYKGRIEQSLGINVDTNSLKVDSILTYSYLVNPEFEKIKILTENFKKRIVELFVNGQIYPVDTFLSNGRLFIGDIYSNSYYDEYDFIIDLGGDDKYFNSCGVVYPYTKRVKFIIDFDGDDQYLSTDSFKVSYGAINGVSFVFDINGNDVYKTYNFSQGSAFIGFSQLHDGGGNDFYSAGFFSQGAGYYGRGEMIDKSGNDIYYSSAFSQGFGFVKGTGILVDSSGDDQYISGTFFKHKPLLENDYLSMSQGFGFGLRPRTCGGVGILVDYQGNDNYFSSVFGQGGSYWHSVGLLFDFSGNDYYSSAQYAQGSGIHLSVGGLFDYSGDDMFFSRYGPSQGEGHDFAYGILVDQKGDDNYTVSGGQGVGLNNSVGIFLDKKGNDSYFSSEKLSNGDVNESRGFSGIGLFIDCEGKDFYSKQSNKDSISWINKYYGFGVDVGFIEEKKEPDTFYVSEDLPIEKIFEISSEWAVRDNFYKVEKARKILLKRENESVKYILDKKISTDDGLELEAMNYLFKNCSDNLKEKLIEKLNRTEDKNTKKNIIYILSQAKYNRSFQTLKEHLSYPDQKIKELSVFAIGNLDTTVDLKFLLEHYDKGSYRLKVEILECLRKHKFDMVELFVKKIDREEDRVVRQAISNYLSEFSSTLRYIQLLSDLKNYEEYITIYKLISNDNFKYLIKLYKEYLIKVSKIEKDDNIAIKGIKKKISSLVEKNKN